MTWGKANFLCCSHNAAFFRMGATTRMGSADRSTRPHPTPPGPLRSEGSVRRHIRLVVKVYPAHSEHPRTAGETLWREPWKRMMKLGQCVAEYQPGCCVFGNKHVPGYARSFCGVPHPLRAACNSVQPTVEPRQSEPNAASPALRHGKDDHLIRLIVTS